MKLNEVHNIDQAMSEGTVYDMDKEYGAPAPKHKPVIARGASSRYDPEAVDPMHPDQRRFQADQDRYLKAQRDAIAKMKAEKGMDEALAMGMEEEFIGEPHHDGSTFKNSLHTIHRVAVYLNKNISADDDIPEWVAEKMGAAKGMLTSVMQYLISEKEMHHGKSGMFEQGDYNSTGTYSSQAIKIGNHFIKEFNLVDDVDQQLAVELVDNLLDSGLTDLKEIRKNLIKYLRQSGANIQIGKNTNLGVAEGSENFTITQKKDQSYPGSLQVVITDKSTGKQKVIAGDPRKIKQQIKQEFGIDYNFSQQGVAEESDKQFAQRMKKKAAQPPTKGMSQKEKEDKGWAKPKEQGVAEGLDGRASATPAINKRGKFTSWDENEPMRLKCQDGEFRTIQEINVLRQKMGMKPFSIKGEQGVAEGSNDTVYPNAEVIKSKNGKPVGEIYQDAHGWGCFHYDADNGADSISSREEAIEWLKDLHNEYRQDRSLREQGVAEGSGGDWYAMALKRHPQLKQVDREKVIDALNDAYEDYLFDYGYEGIGPDEENSLIDYAVKRLKQGVAQRMPQGNYSDEAHPIRDDGNEPPDYAAMYESKLVEFAGGMGAGSVASVPGVGKGSNVGSLFGGSYSQKNSPFKKTKAKKESVIKR